MENYKSFVENAKYYLDKDLHFITNLANISAYIYQEIEQLNWVGFYLYDSLELYLGPFQGKPACTSIAMGRGVCGTAATKLETIVVDDVHAFKDHITCDSESKSEIVIPIVTRFGNLFGVLDVDSPILNRFDNDLKVALEEIVNLMVDIL
ncbi:MAG: GAF domain-containing protein [Bacilli bacterium]|nr:GAF domain-containing protein [Bacilli bacterium]MBN2877616.1 GAF domain-containing protein [Bacilli bacterium]